MAVRLVPADEPGVDVGLACDRRSVSQPGGYTTDAGRDGAFAAPSSERRFRVRQEERHQHGGIPGTEFLGGEVAAGMCGDVVAHLVRVKGPPGVAVREAEQ